LLSAFLKGEERSILHIVCAAPDAPIRELYSECIQLGEVRGFASGPALARGGRAPGWDGRLGAGSLSVTRVLYGSALPVRSTVPITAGNVEEELRSFWALSEQRGAGVVLDASAREGTGELTFAGGVLVEPLARGGGRGGDAPSEDMGAAPLPRLEGLLSAGGASAELTAGALHRVPLDFFCRCTADKFLGKLLSAASPELLDQMAAEEVGGVAAKLECHFCNAAYTFSAAQLESARRARPAAA
jgi:redox-regulated HSP33 family molecular chaperone